MARLSWSGGAAIGGEYGELRLNAAQEPLFRGCDTFFPTLMKPRPMEHEVYGFSEMLLPVPRRRGRISSPRGFSGSAKLLFTLLERRTKTRCRHLRQQMLALLRLYRCHGNGALVKCECIIVCKVVNGIHTTAVFTVLLHITVYCCTAVNDFP